MTTPLLPDTDLARLAPLSDEVQRAQLWKMKTGFSTFSYKHVRACFADIFNVQPAMFGDASPTSFEKIRERLIRSCKSGDEFKSNEQIAKALHEFAAQHSIAGRHHDFFPMAMGIGRKINFWLPSVFAIDGMPYSLFIDPRRTKGLSKAGRRFAFSVMHERIRAADNDFAGVNLGIICFGVNDDGGRTARLYSDKGVTLYSLEELESMVANTYRIWAEVYEERAAETRRKGTGTTGFI